MIVKKIDANGNVFRGYEGVEDDLQRYHIKNAVGPYSVNIFGRDQGLELKDCAEKAQFQKNEKAAMIRANLVVTGNPKDVLGSKDIKQILGVGYTLKEVAMTLNLLEKKNKKSRYLEGLKQL